MHLLLELPEDVQMLVWRFVYKNALNQLLDMFKYAEMFKKYDRMFKKYDMVHFHAYGDRDDDDFCYQRWTREFYE